MINDELRSSIYGYIKDICHLSQMQVFATSTYQRKYLQLQIDDRTEDLINQINLSIACMEDYDMLHASQDAAEPGKKFTPQELADYNGSGGKPPYAAVNKTVYDLSGVPSWQGGTHFGLTAGKDLSSEFMASHFGDMSILSPVPKVGELEENKKENNHK